MYQGIILDEVMVKATHMGFDIGAFIRRVQTDTSYYKAFKTLHLLHYTQYNDIVIHTPDDNEKASYNSITHQSVSGGCRSMTVKQEKVTGNFYKRNHDFNYYTARLYAHLFFY